jgi:RHS repeat-associated protein
VTEWAGYDYQNKLLWTNQAGNFPPAAGQAAAYRLYQYDPNGQPVQIEKRNAGGGVVLDQLDWDGMRKLRRMLCQGQERYTAEYDGSGTRVRSRLYGVDHLYSYGAGLLHDEAGNTVYTPGVSQRKEGADAYFHSDWIGSTRYLTNSTGLTAPTAYRYDAYGRLSAQAGPDVSSSKFAGGHGYESDAPGGLQLLGSRYYDPAVGRFLSPDKLGFAGGLNLFAYCGGDPVNAVDPNGYAWEAIKGQALRIWQKIPIPKHPAVRGGIIIQGGFAVCELATYQPGKPTGIYTWAGDTAGQAIGGVIYPDKGYGPNPKFYEAWQRARQDQSFSADDPCGGGGGGGKGGPSRLFHYTDEAGFEGINSSITLNASMPPRAKYGSGQYLTDVPPEQLFWGTKAEAARQGKMAVSELSFYLHGYSARTHMMTYYVEVDVSDLVVENPAPHIFVVPGENPLGLKGRLRGGGSTR